MSSGNKIYGQCSTRKLTDTDCFWKYIEECHFRNFPFLWRIKEKYIGPYQTCMMELFLQNNPSQMFDTVLTMPLYSLEFSELFAILCEIWYHLCDVKNVKNTHGGVYLFFKLQAYPKSESVLTEYVRFSMKMLALSNFIIRKGDFGLYFSDCHCRWLLLTLA